jgi:hypothetical protein
MLALNICMPWQQRKIMVKVSHKSITGNVKNKQESNNLQLHNRVLTHKKVKQHVLVLLVHDQLISQFDITDIMHEHI